MDSQKYLTEIEIEKIENFCKDVVLLEAVRKVMLQGIYTHGTLQKGITPDPLKNGALSLAAVAINNPIPDEALGQHIRGIWAGLNALENAFNDLKSIKAPKKAEIESPYNEAE